MRTSVLGLTLLGVALATTPVMACPLGMVCLTRRAVAAATEVAPTPSPMPSKPLQLKLMRTAGIETEPPVMHLSFDPMPEAKAIVADMETFWAQLESSVHSQMPKVERKAVTVTFSPVIVAGQFDTVPGVGLSGDY